jgi:hypothetical protein
MLLSVKGESLVIRSNDNLVQAQLIVLDGELLRDRGKWFYRATRDRAWIEIPQEPRYYSTHQNSFGGLPDKAIVIPPPSFTLERPLI